MEEQSTRVLRPRRRGPPSDHTYSSFVPSSISPQYNNRSLPYDISTVSQEITDTNTASSFQQVNAEATKLKESSTAVNGCNLQSLTEIIAWLKEDSTSINRDKNNFTMGRYRSGQRNPDNSSRGYTVQGISDTLAYKTEFSQDTTLGSQSIIKVEVNGEGLSWQSEISTRQRDCVLQKLSGSLSQQQQWINTGRPEDSPPSSAGLTQSLRGQQLEDQIFHSANNQEEYYYRVAEEITLHRSRNLVGRDGWNQGDRKRKYDTNLLRSLLQGDPVSAFTLTPEVLKNHTVTKLSHKEETISSPVQVTKRRRKKRRRNEYDFGQRRRYPKQENQQVMHKQRGGTCQISSHKVEESSSSRGALVTVPVSSGTILEECAEICDLRSSESGDQECVNNTNPEHHKEESSLSTTHPQTTANSHNHPCPFCVKQKLESKERSLRRKTQQWKQGERYSKRLLIKHYKFPFKDLPLECKMNVFSFLDAKSKATASQVCLGWKSLLYDPDAWTRINFDFLDYCNKKLPAPPHPKRPKQRDTQAKCVYEAYQGRVRQFIDFLSDQVHPRLEWLTFHFDIGNFMDNWYGHVKRLLQHAELRRLVGLECGWQVTRAKPSSLERYCCILNKTRVLFKLHHYRAHIFHSMLYQLTQQAPNLTKLKMPFDWSERAVLFLCRWRQLEELRLLQYLNLRPMSQLCVDVVLRSLQYLTLLRIDVCIPVYSHHQLFTLSHNTLVHLDLSNCQGFFLKKLSMPRLKSIQLGRHPWQGALVEGELQVIPCVYSLLCQGTPRLEWVNRHLLHAYWTQFSYQEMETVLTEVCPCSKHWVK